MASGKRPASPEEMPHLATAVWNTELRSRASRFAADHPGATVLLFSSWLTFSDILDKPIQYGLKPGDVHEGFSSVWCDHLHPTSSVHRGVAVAIYDYLSNVKVAVLDT